MTTNKRMVDLDAVEKTIMQEVISLAKENFYSEYRQSLIKVIIPKIQALTSIPNPIDTTQVSRVEVIDEHGRAWTTYKAENVQIDFQDNERTLKIFLKSNKAPLQTYILIN